VDEHPIRLVLSDDLDRTRLTVLFRWLLALPHYFWAGLWGIAVFVVVVVNWFATLVLGRSPRWIHNFLVHYVKYITQLYGYLNLAADPYPPFDGRDGYPVDVTIAEPARQRRWTVALRVFIAVPAMLLAFALTGGPSGASQQGAGRGHFIDLNVTGDMGLLHIVALLGWFAILARGRMPRGLRDAAAYGLSYGAQFWAYLFLLTDRYPNSDPFVALAEVPVREDPIRLEVDDDLRRSRLTVFFRLPLSVPHFVWLFGWGIVAVLAVIASWFVLLVRGRPPATLHRFLSAFLRYQTQVSAFLYLTANPFPGFVGQRGSYPVEVVIAAPGRQKRWKVLLRVILAIPAALLASVYGGLLATTALLGWFAALVTGRVPLGLRNAAALALRYQAQTAGYVMLLNDAYPYSGPCVNATPVAAAAVAPLSLAGLS
jgi:Domain of unknown function (DUF4389)